jgi:hypothetical protein
LEDASAQRAVTTNLQTQASASGVVLGNMRSAAFVGCVQVVTLLSPFMHNDVKANARLGRFSAGAAHPASLWEEDGMDMSVLVGQVVKKCWDQEVLCKQKVGKEMQQVNYYGSPAPALTSTYSSKGSAAAAAPRDMLVTVQHGCLLKDYHVQRSKGGTAQVLELTGSSSGVVGPSKVVAAQGSSGLEDFGWSLPQGPPEQTSVPQYKISCVWPLALKAPASALVGEASGDGEWFTMESVLGAMDGAGDLNHAAPAAVQANASGFLPEEMQQQGTDAVEGAEPALLELYLQRADMDAMGGAAGSSASAGMGLKSVLRAVVVEDGEVLLDHVAAVETMDAGELCLRYVASRLVACKCTSEILPVNARDCQRLQ